MNYDISISNGILTADHRNRIGSSLWEFMWLLDKTTKIDNEKKGYVLHGKPIKLIELAKQMGVTEMTVSRNLHKLEGQRYIDITRTPYGLVIKVNKAKKRFNKKVESEPKRTNINVESPNENDRSNKIITVDNTITTNVVRGKAPVQEVSDLISYLKETMKSDTLDGSERENRRYAWLCLKKFSPSKSIPEGFINAKKVINLAIKDHFHAKNCTSMKYLWYNGMKIVASAKLRIKSKGKEILI